MTAAVTALDRVVPQNIVLLGYMKLLFKPTTIVCVLGRIYSIELLVIDWAKLK